MEVLNIVGQIAVAFFAFGCIIYAYTASIHVKINDDAQKTIDKLTEENEQLKTSNTRLERKIVLMKKVLNVHYDI